MSLSSVASLVTNQLQFIGLLSEIDVTLPDGMDSVLAWFNFANFDPTPYIGNKSDFPIINFRLLFVVISILLPIVITILIMLLFVATHIVFIYATFTTGVLLIFVWLISTYSGVSVVSTTSNSSYIVVGGLLVGLATLVALLVYLISKFMVTAEEKQIGKEDKLSQDRESARKFHRGPIVVRFLASVAFVLAGLVLKRNIDVNLNFSDLKNILSIVGIGLIVVGGLIFLSFATMITERGRRVGQYIQDFIERYGLVVLLGLINASFVPAMSYCATMFLCHKYVCPGGTAFNSNAYRADGDYDTSESLYCDSCVFQNSQCSSANATYLCPGSTNDRNWRNPDVSCDDSVAVLFFISAAIVIAIYAIAVPMLFFLTTRFLTTEIMLAVRLAFPTRSNNPEEDDRSNWRKKLILVRPTAASLYEAYSYGNRYFVLVSLFHRVFIALIMTTVSPFNSYVSIIIATLLHFVMTIVLMWSRPFLNIMEQGLSVVLSILNVINGLFVIALKVMDTDASSTVTIIFFLVNTVIPAIIAAVLFKIAISRETSAADEKKELEMQQRNAAVNDEYLDETDATVDTEMTQLSLDQFTRERYLSYTFMIGGIFFFIACALSLVGVLKADLPHDRISTSPLQQSLEYSLGPYSSWNNMTSSCCCLITAHPSYEYYTTERWVCPGVTLERGRISRDLNHNGTAIRNVCSTAVYSGCVIEIVESRLSLVCSADAKAQLKAQGVSNWALEYYF